MEDKQKITDQEILDLMVKSITVQEWNKNREAVKLVRDENWIGRYIDASGLIGKTSIK